ncbi:tetratricopeptide repeat protein [Cyclobacterium sp. 1_MG-2023]|uniref:tetratricopeptide repeat protein n=1 Tax=Cyclobacterium sp. 1_MG-2023 TaxID=3062681 RepID=UPI0026E2881F|nr:tetratricopeptide repeat protein [Cyclobacterium sp. 1_MG-2023]MDO6437604.1 tetratricopeptide repeat protein [Cyclobacterium sp. 1_MG-2023]
MCRRVWQNVFFYIFSAVLISAGAGLLWVNALDPIGLITLSERINVPLDSFQSTSGLLEFEVQNFLLFDQFDPLPPQAFPKLIQVMGIGIWLLLLLFIVLVTLLKRQAFLIGAGLLILLLSISGVNSLNIGGIGTNYALAISLLFLLVPASVIHLFFNDIIGLGLRLVLIIGLGLLGLAVLIYFSQAVSPTYLFSENIFLMALVMAAAFMLYIGHAFVSGAYLFLAKLNRDVGIKIGWHYAIISSLYLVLMALVFLEVTGDWNKWYLPSFQLLLVLVGVVGYFDSYYKTKYFPQTYNEGWVGKVFYLGGFAVCLLVLFKAEISGNTPMLDFLHHVFAYSQLGFSVMFVLYIWVNFSAIINSGNAIEKIMYNPPFFPYFHMRLGGTIAFLILMVYAAGIIGIQFSTSSTQLSADYYFTTKRPVEASVLYENAFDRYRANDRALYALSNIYLDQNQPTLALKTLERSFEQNPQVKDILLLSRLLEKRSRTNEAVYCLEEGLNHYPGNPHLANNLALVYHRMKLPQKALSTLDRMDGFESVDIQNRIGIKVAQGLPLEEDEKIASSLKNTVNLLAAKNMGYGLGRMVLDSTEKEADNVLVRRAMLRNYLTNIEKGFTGPDFQMELDSMLAQETSSLTVEQNLKESDLILKYKTGRMNQLLTYLNGMAFRFSQDAGYYHAFAGWLLSDLGDFEKAAIEWKQATLKGYLKFTPAHLPFLYFGGMEEEAVFISGTQNVTFPKWMRFDASGQLVSNDTVKLYRELANVPTMLGKDLMPAVESLENEVNKGVLAKEILERKSHWLEEEEIKKMLSLAKVYEQSTGRHFSLEAYLNRVKELGNEDTGFALDGGFNPYLTPLILARLEQVEGDEKRYELLQEACQFNKDPLLWITLVKYCRIIGLDQYASTNLKLMEEWIKEDDLTELQLKFL